MPAFFKASMPEVIAENLHPKINSRPPEVRDIAFAAGGAAVFNRYRISTFVPLSTLYK